MTSWIVKTLPAEPGARLIVATHDPDGAAEPVFFTASRIVGWEVAIAPDREGDPRVLWTAPITIGERYEFDASRQHCTLLFPDGRVESLDGIEFEGTVDDWKRWAAKELIERPERHRKLREQIAAEVQR